MADAREQQREARRQKVLARSQGGHRAPVVDLATQQNEIAPQGATAVLDDDAGAAANQASVDGLLDPATPSAEDAGKSASRLAAERRRQRILSKSTERMAKVQGDRVIQGGEAEGAREEGAGESLDDMLDAAEAEFFGQKQGDDGAGGAGVAEAKPAAPQQAYFKSAKGGGGGGVSRGGGPGGSDVAGAAQGKAGRRGAAGGGFKPVRPEAVTPRTNSTAAASRRRPTGNKALEEKHFDLAAIQSLSRAAGTGKNSWAAGAGSADPARKRLLGGVRFWTGLEGVAKTALLLLAGAGVGGLLLPEARAAVAQAKFEAQHTRGSVDSRSRLELFLAGSGGDRSGGRSESPGALDVDFDASSMSEFGDVVEAVEVPPHDSESDSESGSDSDSGAARPVEAEEGDGGAARTRDAAGQGEYGWARVLEEMADGADPGEDGVVSKATDRFLSFMDYVVGWAHFLSAVSVPWGSAAEISCVSAIYLAVLVRLVVAAVFSGVRVVLGLPAFPPTPSASKPGMVMGMVLASVPTLGKLLAVFNMVKSIFSDTNLVVAGTVLTLAFSLAAEEGAGPRRLAGTIRGALGLAGYAPPEDGSLKEL